MGFIDVLRTINYLFYKDIINPNERYYICGLLIIKDSWLSQTSCNKS